jgi:uncharacterized repeat protein (TIGR03837 family)
MKRSWDIFCSVVDNFGDIGVCWRLARQLSGELGQKVRLWVDDLASFQRLCREVDATRDAQLIGAIEVRRWGAALATAQPADIVIEGFGARLPDDYIAAMAARVPCPVWINLEHLSAEAWVEGCHGLPSPHPRLPLVKYFFFPGFTAKTGGLLVEPGLVQERDEFVADADAVAQYWRTLGIVSGGADTLRVSLFCYENAALHALIATWAASAAPVICIVPAGSVLARLSAILGRTLEPGSRAEHGRLTIAAVPFLEIDRYDRLLWACDINFVRGEDSFVRAQLAARPLVWQAYVQDDDVHIAKQAAFLDRYLAGLDAAPASAVRSLHDCWNRQSAAIEQCWPAFMAARGAVAAHARAWAEETAQGGNLAIRLAEFCRNRLE